MTIVYRKHIFIINPAAGHGINNRYWSRLNHLIREYFTGCRVEYTSADNNACDITRAALRNGCETVIAAGGDGTIDESINGFFEHGCLINPDAILGMVAIGTGSDFRTTIALPKEIESTFDRIKTKRTTRCDIGRISYTAPESGEHQRYFVNIADAGFGAAVVQRTERRGQFQGRILTYFLILLNHKSVRFL
jgi:diacylglycerol kinase family enzyme